MDPLSTSLVNENSCPLKSGVHVLDELKIIRMYLTRPWKFVTAPGPPSSPSSPVLQYNTSDIFSNSSPLHLHGLVSFLGTGGALFNTPPCHASVVV